MFLMAQVKNLIQRLMRQYPFQLAENKITSEQIMQQINPVNSLILRTLVVFEIGQFLNYDTIIEGK